MRTEKCLCNFGLKINENLGPITRIFYIYIIYNRQCLHIKKKDQIIFG